MKSGKTIISKNFPNSDNLPTYGLKLNCLKKSSIRILLFLRLEFCSRCETELQNIRWF